MSEWEYVLLNLWKQRKRKASEYFSPFSPCIMDEWKQNLCKYLCKHFQIYIFLSILFLLFIFSSIFFTLNQMNENQQTTKKKEWRENLHIWKRENLGFIAMFYVLLNHLQVTSKLEWNTKLTTSSFMNSIHGFMQWELIENMYTIVKHILFLWNIDYKQWHSSEIKLYSQFYQTLSRQST